MVVRVLPEAVAILLVACGSAMLEQLAASVSSSTPVITLGASMRGVNIGIDDMVLQLRVVKTT